MRAPPRKPFGATFDSRIRLMTALGLSSVQAGEAIGVDYKFILRRAPVLGIAKALYENGVRRRRACSKLTVMRTKPWTAERRSYAEGRFKSIQPDAFDFTAQRIVRALRWERSPEPVCIDQDHIVACLHARGVTLPELHEHLGVPPIEAVAAIRKFAEARSR